MLLILSSQVRSSGNKLLCNVFGTLSVQELLPDALTFPMVIYIFSTVTIVIEIDTS